LLCYKRAIIFNHLSVIQTLNTKVLKFPSRPLRHFSAHAERITDMH
jgi:hypothetical protein